MEARWLSGILATALLAGCARQPKNTLTFAGFSVARGAYERGLLQGFKAHWQNEHPGQKLHIRETYDGSGAQMRAIQNGLKADIAALSLETEIDKLAKAGFVDKAWRKGRYQGVPATTLVIIGVRPGNPKHILDWKDLARPEVQVVMPNPATSGSAQWNAAAMYGSVVLEKGSDQDAFWLFRGVRSRVKVFGKSGRESMQHFLGGIGDAVVTYECEILERQADQNAIEPVYPPRTLSIEPPVVAVGRIGMPSSAIAQEFVGYLESTEAQTLYAQHFFRPRDPRVDGALPPRSGVFTIRDLGGWKKIKDFLFDPEEGLWGRAGE